VSLSIGGEQRNSILLAVISGELPLQRPFPTLSDFRLQLPFPTLLDFATPSEVGKASRGRSSQLRGGSPPHPRRESSSAFISPSKKRERTGASSSSDFFLSPLPPFPPFPTSASSSTTSAASDRRRNAQNEQRALSYDHRWSEQQPQPPRRSSSCSDLLDAQRRRFRQPYLEGGSGRSGTPGALLRRPDDERDR
jgi:hypothetical protein